MSISLVGPPHMSQITISSVATHDPDGTIHIYPLPQGIVLNPELAVKLAKYIIDSQPEAADGSKLAVTTISPDASDEAEEPILGTPGVQVGPEAAVLTSGPTPGSDPRVEPVVGEDVGIQDTETGFADTDEPDAGQA